MRIFTGQLAVLCLLTLLVVPVPAIASGLQPPTTSPTPASSLSPGLDEQLGALVPLDARFRDENGNSVRLGDLITVPTVIIPVYYSCTNVCNTLQGEMAATLTKIRQKPVTDYRVLSVSFDDTEKPALAARYKKMYLTAMHAPFPAEGWRFLTGDRDGIMKLTSAAGYHFTRQGRDFIHPVACFVVSPQGKIVRYLYGTGILPKDLSLALMEAQQGRSGSSVRRVLDFCFSYDPVGKTYVFNLLRVSATVVLLVMVSFVAFLLLTGKKTKRRAEP